ncbi:MAG: hypothetical protein ACOC42_03920, partial [Halobacteriota archaeon]
MSLLGRAYATIRANWRVSLLVVLVLVATYFLFVPGATIGDEGLAGEDESGVTNLQFGIELAGGARISAPVNGLTAEDVQLETVD